MIRKVIGVSIVLVCAAMSSAATDSNCVPEVLGNFRVVCVAGDIIKSGPIVENGKVVLRTQSGLEVFDLATGGKLWSKSIATKVKIMRKPFVKNGVIYLAENRKELLAFDLLTGEKLWDKKSDGILNIIFEPIVHKDIFYIAASRKIYALDSKTGRTIWSISDDDSRFNDVLILKDSKIIAYNLTKLAFIQIDCESGKYQTMPQADYFGGPGVLMKDGVKICYLGMKILESGTKQAFVCIDYESGETHWKTPLSSGYFRTKLCLYGSSLYSTAHLSDLSECILHSYDVNSGKLLWKTNLDKPSSDFSSISFKGDLLYWSNIDSLYCISTKDRRILSKFKGQDLTPASINNEAMLIGEGRKLLIIDDLSKLCN